MTKARKEFWGLKKAFEIFNQEDTFGYQLKSKAGIIDADEKLSYQPVT